MATKKSASKKAAVRTWLPVGPMWQAMVLAFVRGMKAYRSVQNWVSVVPVDSDQIEDVGDLDLNVGVEKIQVGVYERGRFAGSPRYQYAPMLLSVVDIEPNVLTAWIGRLDPITVKAPSGCTWSTIEEEYTGSAADRRKWQGDLLPVLKVAKSGAVYPINTDDLRAGSVGIQRLLEQTVVHSAAFSVVSPSASAEEPGDAKQERLRRWAARS